MKTEADYYALFDEYLSEQLDASTRAELERRLAADPVLATRLAEYRQLTGTLHAYGQRLQLGNRLRALQQEIDAEQATETALPTGRPDMPTMHISRTEQWLREFWHGHRATMAVAASVAVIAVFATMLGLEWWKTQEQSSIYGYTVLRREVDRIKRTQRDMNRAINQIGGTSPEQAIKDGKFSGTGFALTSNGYVVTSYHVIQGADSVMIESRSHQRYRAETVYSDVAHDLAILRVRNPDFTGFGRLPYSFKRREADLGERIYTLGYPREDVVFGEGSLSAHTGFEGDTAFYQISIPVNPGNSGGPVLDDRGNLIGIVSGKQMDVQSAAFATKSSYLMHLVDSLSAAGSATKPYSLPKSNLLAGQSRPQQLRKLQDFIFVVKVYE